MYKFQPILKPLIWGGERIVSFKQIESDLHGVGESWELSAVPGNLSVVSEGADKGLTIVELIDKYRDLLMGRENYARYGNTFPLLIKFIDACQDLSVQVHPDDELAMKRHNSFGKTEMWYVVETSEDAHLSAGWSKEVTKEEYVKSVEDGTVEGLLNTVGTKPGDVFFLPAGRVHALGAGCFIAEVQETSNVTYRIYDYNRRDAEGNLRELHTEEAVDAIDYTYEKEYKTLYTPSLNEPVQLVSCSHFTTSLYDLTESMECDYSELDSFVIYICVGGAAKLVDDNGVTMGIRAGETVLVPASVKNVAIQPEAGVKLMEVFV